MARKAETEEPKETQQGATAVTPEGGAEGAAAEVAGAEQPSIQSVTQEEPSSAGAGAAPPSTVISEVDHSLLSAQSPLLSRQQLKDLRSKLKTKFH